MSEVVPSVEEFIVSPAIRDALLGLDTLDVGNIFRRRPSVMRSKVSLRGIPFSIEGCFARDSEECRASGRGDPVPGLETLLVVASHVVVQTPAATSRSDLLNVLPLSHVANGNSSGSDAQAISCSKSSLLPREVSVSLCPFSSQVSRGLCLARDGAQ